MASPGEDVGAPARTRRSATQSFIGPGGRLAGSEDLAPGEIERYWFEHCYQGDDMPQLTLRAVAIGMVLGMVLSLSNLYAGLKVGWSLGVSVVACVLAYSISLLFHKIGIFRTPLSILECNCMQSTASTAGYSTGGILVSAVPAYLMLTGQHIGGGVLVAWLVCTAGLGVMLAVPMKRQLVNVEQLPFPTGLAAAETMRSLYAEGGGASRTATLALVGSGAFGAVIAYIRDRLEWIPGAFGLASISAPFTAGKRSLAEFTLCFEGSAMMLAAGALMGLRAGWSIFLGAVVNYGVLAPWMYGAGDIHASGKADALLFRDITKWSVWPGVSILVSSGLLLFAMEWRTVARAFSGLATIFGKKSASDDPMERVEVPGAWFLGGSLAFGAGVVIVAALGFAVAWWMGVIAVLLAFVLCIVSCRVTGETDTTPQGPMGKIVQLTYGVLAPSNIPTNLMTASITANTAATSGDLLTELKSGYLLGANPRRQFIAQLLGVFAGAAFVVPFYFLLIPDASVLGTSQWPAPAAQTWSAVARLLADGIGSLPVSARRAAAGGGLFGLLVPILERLWPKTRSFLPMPSAFGLGFLVNGFNCVSMFLGALAGYLLMRFARATAEKYTTSVASGLIAGESLTGVGIAVSDAVTGLLGKK